MNQKTPYELIITGKLDQVPLPDLQDSIWARIEQQLDIDMPTDDGGSDPGPQSPSGGGMWIGGIGLSVFVVALLTILFINKNNKIPNNPQPETTTPATQTVTPQDQTGEPPPGTVTLPATTTPAPTNTPVPVAGDTALASGTPPPTGQPVDSAATDNTTVTQPPPITAAVPPPKDTVPPGKKPRGVPGINPNDYRIVPKKDSGQ